MKKTDFKNYLKERGYSFTRKGREITVNHQGYVYLSSLTTLPAGTKFENQGYVDLSSLTTLPAGTKFENQGSVDLRSLTGKHEYQGQSREFRSIDGYTMLITSKRTAGELTIFKARYFGGGPIEKLKSCYIAQRGDYFAHGETAAQAIQDVTFKILQSSADKSEIVAEVKKSKRVTLVQYRLLTGACQAGCEHFLSSHGIPLDTESLPLAKVLAMTSGAFGGDKMRELFGKGAA